MKMEPQLHPINSFFTPKSVAVFGASTNPLKSGYKLAENLLTHNFSGKIYLINPKGGTLQGRRLYKNLGEINNPVELAVIFVPGKHVIGVIQECIDKNVKAAIIESAGFGEVGDEGRFLKKQLQEITGNFSKIRIVGPNCTGITYLNGDGKGLYSSFVPLPEISPGPVVMISQSGFVNGAFFIDIVTRYDIGFRAVCALGNKIDLNENDLLEYFLNDPQTQIICLYIESFQDVRKFISLSNLALTKFHKKVVILRGGTSKVGSQAVNSHTGAIAEDSNLIDAVLKQSHAIVAEDFRDIFKLARSLEYFSEMQLPYRSNKNVGIITISGGAGAVFGDWCEKFGLSIPNLAKISMEGLVKLFPPWMKPNPFALIDIWPAVEHAGGDYQTVLEKTLEIALDDENLDAIILTAFYARNTWTIDYNIINKIIQHKGKPVFIWLFGQFPDIIEAELLFHKLRLPTFISEREITRNISKILPSLYKRN